LRATLGALQRQDLETKGSSREEREGEEKKRKKNKKEIINKKKKVIFFTSDLKAAGTAVRYFSHSG